jgi:hypothetical protein
VAEIAENLARVRRLIAEAAIRGGHDPERVVLVAVSKNRSPGAIAAAREAGQKVFGENRAQELREKIGKLPRDVEWHFIGHLQTNKVNMVVGNVTLIHSIDSERLAAAVAGRAASLGLVQDVLVQVNVSGEESKFGADSEEVHRLIGRVLGQPALRLRGLMTIAPIAADPEEARPCFRRLRELRDELAARFPEARLDWLSMGMSQDFQVAVEEGANMVRIGTAIFSDLD